MALPDPLPMTIDAVLVNHNLISRTGRSSIYRSADGTTQIEVSHQEGTKRARRLVRFTRFEVTADPFVPSENREISYSMYAVVDEPIVGFADADILLDFDGFKNMWNAQVPAMLQGES